MSRTVAEAQAAYRKRRADKMARYEAALREIAAAPGTRLMPSYDTLDAARVAQRALDGRARND